MMAKNPKRKGVNTLTRTIDLQHPMSINDIADEMSFDFVEGKRRLYSFRRLGAKYYLHHTAKFPTYASRMDEYRFFAYGGRYGNGFVRFVPIPNQRGSLCTIEYWIRQGES